jgi:hypothetical protein
VRRTSIARQHRMLLLRPVLHAVARAHASEHRISIGTVVREVQSVAAMIDAADLGDQRHPSTKSPLIPAYKTRGPNGALLIQFRCPACKSIHSHGTPASMAAPLQHRVSHCTFDFGQARSYRLLVVGWKQGDDLPTCSADEIDSLNGVICESAG